MIIKAIVDMCVVFCSLHFHNRLDLQYTITKKTMILQPVNDVSQTCHASFTKQASRRFGIALPLSTASRHRKKIIADLPIHPCLHQRTTVTMASIVVDRRWLFYDFMHREGFFELCTRHWSWLPAILLVAFIAQLQKLLPSTYCVIVRF